MKVLRVVTLAALVCFSSVASAQDIPQKRDDWSPTAKFLFVEGLIGVSALLASQYPRAFGGLEAVVVPYAAIASSADPKASPVEPWLILVGGGALVVYNLKVD